MLCFAVSPYFTKTISLIPHKNYNLTNFVVALLLSAAYKLQNLKNIPTIITNKVKWQKVLRLY